jgi:hypothetical protein
MENNLLGRVEAWMCPLRHKCEQINYECERSTDYKYCNEYQRLIRREKIKLTRMYKGKKM